MKMNTNTSSTVISKYNNQIYGIDTKTLQKKREKNIDYNYFLRKTREIIIKFNKLADHNKMRQTNAIYFIYKYANDHFDIIVNELIRVSPNKQPMKLLWTQFNKIEEHSKILQKIHTIFINSNNEKLYNNTLKQMYKFHEKFANYQHNVNQHIIDVLHKLPEEVVLHDILPYLGIINVK